MDFDCLEAVIFQREIKGSPERKALIDFVLLDGFIQRKNNCTRGPSHISRDIEIILKRAGTGGHKKHTYRALSEEYNISMGRCRQIFIQFCYESKRKIHRIEKFKSRNYRNLKKGRLH